MARVGSLQKDTSGNGGLTSGKGTSMNSNSYASASTSKGQQLVDAAKKYVAEQAAAQAAAQAAQDKQKNLSATAKALMANVAANNPSTHTPQETIDAAKQFLKGGSSSSGGSSSGGGKSTGKSGTSSAGGGGGYSGGGYSDGIGGVNSDPLALLRQNYNNSVKSVNDRYALQEQTLRGNAEDELRAAYINYMMNRRNSANDMARLGYSGGLSESNLARLYNNYGTIRNDINKRLDEAVKEYNVKKNAELLSLLNSYNNQQLRYLY